MGLLVFSLLRLLSGVFFVLFAKAIVEYYNTPIRIRKASPNSTLRVAILRYNACQSASKINSCVLTCLKR